MVVMMVGGRLFRAHAYLPQHCLLLTIGGIATTEDLAAGVHGNGTAPRAAQGTEIRYPARLRPRERTRHEIFIGAVGAVVPGDLPIRVHR